MDGRNLRPVFELTPEIRDALTDGRPVVALESTIISHGLPRPRNLEVAARIEQDVREQGAVPATIAVLDGRVRVGLDEAGLERVATGDDVVKVSTRDLALLCARGGDGATTVAATSHAAAAVGITLFATGGLGGVHLQAQDTFDESADLTGLSRTGVAVVCSGVKSILDVPATLERLESLGVAVAGYRTLAFPGFYLRDSGWTVPWQLDTPEQVAAVLAERRRLGTAGAALVLANPVDEADQLAPQLHERVLQEALEAARRQGIRGKDVTPFLLTAFHEGTDGASLETNIALVRSNARLAAQIAVADSARGLTQA